MSGKWKAPEGYVLTEHDGYHLNEKGFRAAEDDSSRLADGKIGVAWFSEDEPFTDDNSPNAQVLPIVDGWVPPVFTLVHEDDESAGAVEPHEGSES